MTSAGRWTVVAVPGAPGRHDWVPDAQPAAPAGRPGQWHVVPDADGGESRWEWFDAAPDAPAGPEGPGAPPRRAAPSRVPRRRLLLGAAAACFVVALRVGIALPRAGGASAVDVTPPARTVDATAIAESGCADPTPEPAQQSANSRYRCHGFDLYVYRATRDRDGWVIGFQQRGRVVRTTGTNWIALEPT